MFRRSPSSLLSPWFKPPSTLTWITVITPTGLPDSVITVALTAYYYLILLLETYYRPNTMLRLYKDHLNDPTYWNRDILRVTF